MSKDDDDGSCIYCLVEKEFKIRKLDAYYLYAYINDKNATYMSAEDAEEGRKNGDAFDEIGKTRVVGFRITPFLPKKRKNGRKAGRRNTSQTAAAPEIQPFHRNPDGSYEGFVDAGTANKLLKEMALRSTECAVMALQKKDEYIRQEIEVNKRKGEMT